MTSSVYGRQKKSGSHFFAGVFTGLLLSAVLAAAGGYYLYKNPQRVTQVVVKEANHAVRRTMESMPKDYLAQREAEISALFSHFVRAYSMGKITAEGMDAMTQSAFQAASDQVVTPAEIDELLAQMRRILKQAQS